MYIEAIVLEGFKSYSNRVYVGPLHPQFNAVTGLNGTGKSNILDSICFVLGITNHALVRATKLDDLVYKQGQAGVTKATVTLKFRNDPHQQNNPLPFPYREMPEITITRQIVIGGRDRYLLNSRNAQLKEVRDFFHCCQMNINSPHFMIQQGKITKVINMKPKEVLGLIEEVSGTRMYELKRGNAVKLMQKKEQKLQEISVVLREEIEPTIERLRKEKQEYFNFVSMKEEMQRFQRFDVAYRFYSAKQLLQQGTSDFDELTQKKAEIEAQIAECDRETAAAQKQLEDVDTEREKLDGPLQRVRQKKEEVEKLLAKRHSEEKTARRDLKLFSDALEDLKKEEQKLAKKLAEKRASRLSETSHAEAAEEEVKRVKEALENAEKKLEGLSTGGAEAGGGASLREKLKQAKTKAAQLEAEEEDLKTELKHVDEELRQVRAKLNKSGESAAQMTTQRDAAAARVAALEKQLAAEAVDEEKLASLREEMKLCRREIDAAKHEAQESQHELNSWSKIAVRLPRGMHPHKLHGQVFELVELKNDYLDFAKALQLLVGGKLEYVVVEDKDASKAIFKENNFASSRRRVTLLPIQDCQVGKICDTATLFQNRRLVGLSQDDPRVLRCLDVIDFDANRHEKVALYTFGGSLICATAEMAEKITYQPNKRQAFPTVTVEGDVFQTGGVMAGGGSGHVKETLLLWKNFKRCSQMSQELEERARQIDFYLQPMEQTVQRRTRVTRELRLAQNELHNIEQLMATSSAGSEMARAQQLEERRRDCTKRKEEVEAEKGKVLAEVQQLEADVYELEHNRDKLEASLKKEVKVLRQRLKSLEASVNTLQKEIGSFRQELMTLEKDLQSVQEDIEKRTQGLADLQKAIEEKSKLVAEQKAKVEDVRKEIELCLSEAAQSDKKLGELTGKLKKLQKNKDHLLLTLKKHQHLMNDREKNIGAARQEMEALQRANDWLHAEERKFNQPGSAYDFRQLRPETARQRLQALQVEVQRLQKSVNSAAATLLEKTEKDLLALVERKTQVENDKAKIEAVISELDIKKRQSLETTWLQVNENFTGIFEQLLPNAQAKLAQVNPRDLMDGLEMRIAFNKRWKESLAELSGGQRSLLALSLILALLKVKPAPVYILDEVDAALDLSHTQNIGSMIKTQFPTSQFIIVSLKEGMFSHADVLFRTRLIDGVSNVERHALAERPQRRDGTSASDDAAGSARKKFRKHARGEDSGEDGPN
ncbi:RecF/RecN/SMC N terminal domain-containing protein [Toxoplasma gondii ME49]|uniref:Structural maintenance of chromosomes protein n=1 Tax=Toxoplasma gondii (strain ATCC 50611 / Me49) TaxID=508771 RepID=S8GK01_TOXGM|nr:RecF/RecN/SMC N terminal domain-containing protein [Toxoplasma gondii ME49]EPT32195.1 RecF/RecN/SMC N terminal domain-containing protein [Toxoplasma gondii ME49]|eukprot:XP_018638378.1 RecF/RecN/SMC N terminal domain-containing protein [Toxoplasma gondii ME49]